MTDQGRGYGSQPWPPAEPGYPEQHFGGAEYAGQDSYAQPQDVYGQGQYVLQGQGYAQQPQGYPSQEAYAQQPEQYAAYPGQQPMPQDPYGGQQWQQQAQPGFPQQQTGQQQAGYPAPGAPQGYPQQVPFPQQHQPVHDQVQRPMPGPAPVQAAVQAPVQAPAGPGPDGIDWEAAAAALDDPQAGYVEGYEDGLYEDGLYVEEGAEDGHLGEDYVGEDYVEGELPEGELLDGDEAEHESFFGAVEEDNSREAQRKRKEKGKKSGRRNRGACLVVALVLLGGVGGAGWFGYGFYKSHFGPPPDYIGNGTGSVTVTIAPGAGGADMAQTLLAAGVVKSAGAFTDAYNKNPQAMGIQAGSYTLHSQMSGAAAVQLLVSAAGGNALIVPEGKKAVDIYAMIDTKLKLAAGTTAGVAKSQVANLGLPAYAGNNPEGFLWPTKYSITPGMQPLDLLKQMVANANQEYSQVITPALIQQAGLKTTYDVITEASILQAEGNNSQDFGKMARVIYNRLNTDVTHHTLGMDTTLQYSVGSTALTKAQINDGSNKYNTYINPGLPPTPISNPGDEAIQAVLNPTPGTWAYFIAMSPTETLFSTSSTDFAANVKQYCTSHGQAFDAQAVHCE
ncbi:endolytic transglycosylase MltG [Kitasatospora sp. NPDC052896]|uniref:endolytic transglycosylase MltG n=1 Tax=Kitasatospora sp. NPDC052896 TaxID=3364061 RepID=UPI0037C7FA33